MTKDASGAAKMRHSAARLLPFCLLPYTYHCFFWRFCRDLLHSYYIYYTSGCRFWQVETARETKEQHLLYASSHGGRKTDLRRTLFRKRIRILSLCRLTETRETGIMKGGHGCKKHSAVFRHAAGGCPAGTEAASVRGCRAVSMRGAHFPPVPQETLLCPLRGAAEIPADGKSGEDPYPRPSVPVKDRENDPGSAPIRPTTYRMIRFTTYTIS